MPFNPLDAIDMKERLSFSQNFTVSTPSVLDTIFPDIKSQFFKAEYYRLMSGALLPDAAFVHSLDTEAEIGQRVGFEKVEAEKLFIKRKINQTEAIRMAIENGVSSDDALINYVYDDSARLFESVLSRTKVMKAHALCRGELDINENNVKMNVDFRLPSDNKFTMSDWSQPTADIDADIAKAIEILEDNGYVANRMTTSRKVIGYMRNNEKIIAGTLGVNNARTLTKQEIANYMMSEYGITINVCDEKFRVKQADGTLKTERYFDEDVVSIYEANADGSFGSGLWGPTPEEDAYNETFALLENRSFITLTMWEEKDPVARWTKASGLFIPVMPKANGLVIGKLGK